MRKLWWGMIGILLLLLALVTGGLYWWREVYSNPYRSQNPWQAVSAEMPAPAQGIDLEAEVSEGGRPAQNQVTRREVRTNLPAVIDREVPFTAQAPLANWSLPWGEFCEEASALMAAAYFKGEGIGGPEEAAFKLRAIQAWEEKEFGYYKDTTVDETGRILKEFLGVENVFLLTDPTADDMRRLLADNKLLLVPAAGRELPNPYYTSPGPYYHMLVVRGFTGEGKFITNDPGTRRGEGFEYEEEVLMDAIHDWNGGDVERGAKVVIAVSE